jgi:hypothetical protein
MPLFGPNIAKLQAARDVDGLIKALDHARPEIQAGAARALAAVADPRALPAIVLRLSPDRDYSKETREAAKEAVRAIATVDALAEILRTGDPASRSGAVLAVAVLGDARGVDALLSVLGDPNESESLRTAVAYVLGDLPDPRSVDALIPMLTKESGVSASRSLAKIGDPRAIEPLVVFLIDRLREVSRAAAEQGYLPNRQITDLLVKETLAPLVDSIGAFGPASVDPLRSRMAGEADEFVQLGIESALRRLDEQGALARGPSVTIWVPDKAAGERLMAGIAGGGSELIKALDPKDPAHIRFINAVLAAEVGTTIAHEARTNPERGGIDITLTIPVPEPGQKTCATPAPPVAAGTGPPAGDGGVLRLMDPAHAARAALDEAARIVDRDVELAEAGDAAVLHSSSAILEAIPHLDHAAELAPDDLDVLIAKAAVLQGGMQFKSAQEVLDAILEKEPGHFDARVWKDHWDSWASALRFPCWGGGRTSLHPVMARGLDAGRRVQVVRDGLQKTVAIVLGTDCPAPPPGTRPVVQWVLSRTPAGPLVAYYADLIEPGGQAGPSEGFIPIFEPTHFHPAVGYFLMEQLASSPYCWVILVSSAGVQFNERLVFDAGTATSLRNIAAELHSLTSYLPQERFQEATRWHMDHFDMDRMTFT